jgi:hypothetical protein
LIKRLVECAFDHPQAEERDRPGAWFGLYESEQVEHPAIVEMSIACDQINGLIEQRPGVVYGIGEDQFEVRAQYVGDQGRGQRRDRDKNAFGCMRFCYQAIFLSLSDLLYFLTSHGKARFQALPFTQGNRFVRG